MTPNDYERWLDTCLAAGLPALRLDTCCRLLAITYVIGGSMEAFTFNAKLNAEVRYAQRRCNIAGSETPDPDCIEPIKAYVKELEDWYNDRPSTDCEHPRWVETLMEERYGITQLAI